MDITCAPIEQWPGQRTRVQQISRFKSTWTATTEVLFRELAYLKARSVVLQMDITAGDVRNDGWIRANARPKSSAVILSFNTPKGAMSFPCDRFDRWQDNVRAIALSLEALRKVDRYGVTQNNEQYRGWTKLPPASNSSDVFSSREQAMNWIANFMEYKGAWITLGTLEWKALIRKAEIKAHPDSGGNAQWFKAVAAAKELILN